VTLTRWFRQHQRYMIAGLVMLLMASWGVLSTVRTLVGTPKARKTILGRDVQPGDTTDAEHALTMMLRLGLLSDNTPYAMMQRGAPLRAIAKMRALADDFSQFVFAGGGNGVSYDAAWRYLVLLYEADAAGVQVTQGEITELLGCLPQFSDKTGFRSDVYVAILNQLGLQDADMARWFEQMCRVAKLIELHREAVLVSNAELWMAYVYSTENVRILYVALDGSLFRPLVQATDEDLKKFYEDHRDFLPADSKDGIGYKAPERVRAEYALVPIDELAKQVQVTDKEIASYYDAHKEDYRLPEQPAPKPQDKQPAADEKKPAQPSYKPLDQVSGDIRQQLIASKAKEEADKVADAIMADLQAVRDNYENMPQPLEQIARRHGAQFQTVKTATGRPLVSSQELASLVPDGKELAAFAFQTNANLYFPKRVESDSGPVVLQVLEYRQPETQPYEDVQAQVRADCLQSKAIESARTFADKLAQQADTAGMEAAAADMTRRLDNLLKTPQAAQPPVLKVQESASFRRTSPDVAGIQGNTQADLIRTAFSLSGKKTAVVTTGTPPTDVYVIQAAERSPASPQGFATLNPMTRILYQTEKQRRQVQAWMQGLLDKAPSAATVKGQG
jgi:hypothetical protein